MRVRIEIVSPAGKATYEGPLEWALWQSLGPSQPEAEILRKRLKEELVEQPYAVFDGGDYAVYVERL